MAVAFLADRVKETTQTTGTGSLFLNGAYPGYQTFAAGIGSGSGTFYCITLEGRGQWETGWGIVDINPPQLIRHQVYKSSNNNQLVDFSLGDKDVFLPNPADKAVFYDIDSKNLTLSGSLVVSSSLQVLGSSTFSAVTSSFKGNGAQLTGLSASILLSGTSSGDFYFNGNITVPGTASFGVLHTSFTTSSVEVSSGSTIFGVSLDNTHQFTGSVSVTGSSVFSGPVSAVSFQGDGAEITGIISSSYATSASFASVAAQGEDGFTAPSVIVTGLLTGATVVASGPITASAFQGTGAGITGVISSSYSAMASSASAATIASQGMNGFAAPSILVSGLAQFNGGTIVTGSVKQTGSLNVVGSVTSSLLAISDGTSIAPSIAFLSSPALGFYKVSPTIIGTPNAISAIGAITASAFQGNGAALTNLTAANIIGTVASATNASSATTAISSSYASSGSATQHALQADTAVTASYTFTAQNVINSVTSATSASFASIAAAGMTGFAIAGSTALHAANFNSFAPTLTGIGASGTWSINVTGTANNITAYTINQNVGSANAPTFAGLTSNQTIIVGSSATGATEAFLTNGITTGAAYARFPNASGSLLLGIESAGGQSLFVGTSGYATVIGNQNAGPLQFATNNTVRMTLNSAGTLDTTALTVGGVQAVTNSGTWNISISGNAATATSATTATSASAALSAHSVDGLQLAPAGGTPSNNQIIRTDNTGYAYFTYINANTANNENPAISQVIVTNGTDNYYRKASLAALGLALTPASASFAQMAASGMNGFSAPSILSTGNIQANISIGVGQAPEANNAVAARSTTSTNGSNIYLGRNSGGASVFAVDGTGAGYLATGLNTNSVTSSVVWTNNGGVTDTWNNTLRIMSPGGAAFITTAATPVGAFKIALPAACYDSTTMMRFTVKMYDYSMGTCHTFIIGGYNYSGQWINTHVEQFTDDGDQYTVRFGRDGTHNCVWIGETSTVWSYPQVFVTDFVAGFNNTTFPWQTGWSIAVATAFDTVDSTYTPAYNIHSKNFNNYSPTLTGTGASGNWGINASNITSYPLNQSVATTAGVTFAGLTLQGQFNAESSFSSYTADGLFGATSLPNYIYTVGGVDRKILFGYWDNGAGLYAPRIGFQSASGGSFSMGLYQDTNFYFTVGNMSNIAWYVNNGGAMFIGQTLNVASAATFQTWLTTNNGGIFLGTESATDYVSSIFETQISPFSTLNYVSRGGVGSWQGRHQFWLQFNASAKYSAMELRDNGGLGYMYLPSGLLQVGAYISRFENTYAVAPPISTGVGVELGVSGGEGVFQTYNRTSLAYAPSVYAASSHSFNSNVIVSAGGITVTGGSHIINGGLLIDAGGVRVGTNAGVTGAMLSAVGGGSDIEFGHANSSGYRGTIGAEASSGLNFLAFHSEAGATDNTYTTRGVAGSIIRADGSGGLGFFKTPNANAVNQTPFSLMSLDTSGNLAAIGAMTIGNHLNVTNGYGIQVPAVTGMGFYSNSPYWLSRSNNGFEIQDNGGTVKGYLFFDASGYGLLGSTGGWGLRIPPGSNNIYIDNGLLNLGNSITTSAISGDIVVPNNRALCAVNAGNTDTTRLIYLDASNNVQVGPNCTVQIASAGATTYVGGAFVISGALYLGTPASNQYFATFNSTYNQILTPDNVQALTAGSTVDPTTYYANTTHKFRNRTYATVYATIDSSGMTLGVGAYYTPSSRTIKENIAPVTESALDVLNTIEIVSFNYIKDEQKHHKIGFIAEDTHEWLAGKDHTHLDVTNNIGMLIKAVQELSTQNRSLATELQLLREELNASK